MPTNPLNMHWSTPSLDAQVSLQLCTHSVHSLDKDPSCCLKLANEMAKFPIGFTVVLSYQ